MAITNKVCSDFSQNFSKLWLPVPADMLAHEPEVGQLWRLLGKRTLNPKHQTLLELSHKPEGSEYRNKNDELMPRLTHLTKAEVKHVPEHTSS